MKTWDDIYKTIAEDANGQYIYRPANYYGDGKPETMCVMGGLALAAGLNIRWEQGGFPKITTQDAVDYVVENYPLTLEQCNYLVSVNDDHSNIEKRREALIAQVREYVAEVQA